MDGSSSEEDNGPYITLSDAIEGSALGIFYVVLALFGAVSALCCQRRQRRPRGPSPRASAYSISPRGSTSGSGLLRKSSAGAEQQTRMFVLRRASTPPSSLDSPAATRITFFALLTVASALRATYFALQVMLGLDLLYFPRWANILLDKTPSFIFCTTFTILLSLWGEMWAAQNMLRGRFKPLFIATNVVLYLLLVSLGVTQALQDDGTPARAGNPLRGMLPTQKALAWVTTVLYVPVALMFFVSGYNAWSSSLQPAIPSTTATAGWVQERAQQPVVTLIVPFKQLRAVARMSMVCLVLMILRCMVLVGSNVAPELFEPIWVELVYYTMLEVLPLVLMIVALNRTTSPCDPTTLAIERSQLVEKLLP